MACEAVTLDLADREAALVRGALLAHDALDAARSLAGAIETGCYQDPPVGEVERAWATLVGAMETAVAVRAGPITLPATTWDALIKRGLSFRLEHLGEADASDLGEARARLAAVEGWLTVADKLAARSVA